ncbi:hypothetical protein CLU83_0003 [Flavobacterium sp. 1]|uniref:hypothetical protein n=1 Tax=Flavobacterium sp. 1 TaxID=2035200 RepID=UPI000C2402E5|nr:hypothetical protein [Flavobacterium sp. 1]PJJ06889.1 hypothetical protein CLU83_0003 [Flavobacterium sp. 1]
MNNFFLLNEAIKDVTIEEFELGIEKLNKIQLASKKDADNLLIHEDFWQFKTDIGSMYNFTYSLVSNELQILIPKLFGSFTATQEYFSNELDFDNKFPNACNGFLGINFSNLGISEIKQITDEELFKIFKETCNANLEFTSIKGFWEIKENIFTKLVFCDNVLEQISHFSVNDDRFKLIFEKLKILNNFTKNWKTGNFEYKNLGLDNSPDTPTRIRNTESLRTFTCADIGPKIFSLHIKWSFGREAFRLYYYPDNVNKKVHIGYIGPKDDIGF